MTDSTHQETFDRLRTAREQALQHHRLALQYSAERRQIMEALMAAGVSQAEIARQLGVTRQAVQKMLAS